MTGPGELTFTATDPQTGIEYDVIFDKMYECKASIQYEDAGEGQTRVIWSMTGDTEIPVMGGYLASMIKGQCETMFGRGLERLDEQVTERVHSVHSK